MKFNVRSKKHDSDNFFLTNSGFQIDDEDIENISLDSKLKSFLDELKHK